MARGSRRHRRRDDRRGHGKEALATAHCIATDATGIRVQRLATGRTVWLSVGSDLHGVAAGHVLTLIASARLHKLDLEVYLRDVFRVLPHWPRDRYLELAPRHWRITRARLRRDELDREVGWLTILELPLPTMPELRPARDAFAAAPAAP